MTFKSFGVKIEGRESGGIGDGVRDGVADSGGSGELGGDPVWDMTWGRMVLLEKKYLLL